MTLVTHIKKLGGWIRDAILNLQPQLQRRGQMKSHIMLLHISWKGQCKMCGDASLLPSLGFPTFWSISQLILDGIRSFWAHLKALIEPRNPTWSSDGILAWSLYREALNGASPRHSLLAGRASAVHWLESIQKLDSLTRKSTFLPPPPLKLDPRAPFNFDSKCWVVKFNFLRSPRSVQDPDFVD